MHTEARSWQLYLLAGGAIGAAFYLLAWLLMYLTRSMWLVELMYVLVIFPTAVVEAFLASTFGAVCGYGSPCPLAIIILTFLLVSLAYSGIGAAIGWVVWKVVPALTKHHHYHPPSHKITAERHHPDALNSEPKKTAMDSRQ